MSETLYKDVMLSSKAPFGRGKRLKKTVRDGLAFEAMALEVLQSTFNVAECYPSQWISYRDSEGRERHAQPDLFVVARDSVIIFECKLRHTPQSFSQLSKYRELLTELFPDKVIYLVEVYKFMDWVAYPTLTYQLQLPFPLSDLREDEVGLLNIFI